MAGTAQVLDCKGKGQVRVYPSTRAVEITLYRLVEGDVQYLSASCMIKGMDSSLDIMMGSDTVLYTVPEKFTRS